MTHSKSIFEISSICARMMSGLISKECITTGINNKIWTKETILFKEKENLNDFSKEMKI
jgi:hypothetical protein